MVSSPAPRRTYCLECKSPQKKTTHSFPEMKHGASSSASVIAEPPVQSSPASREEPQSPASGSSDSDVFISASEYPTPEIASPADKPKTPDEPNTPSEPYHAMLLRGANDNQTGRRTPMPGTRKRSWRSSSNREATGHPPPSISSKKEAQRRGLRLLSRTPVSAVSPPRGVPRNRATPSAGSAARSPRSPSHGPGSTSARTTRLSDGAGGSSAALRTRPRSRSRSRGHTSKSLRHARRPRQPSDRRTTPSAGTGTSGSASSRTTTTRVNGAAGGGSVNYVSAGTYGEELSPAAT
ncbi:hypothetical protein DL767_001208 [Monosporascus sp. MG133]|nr:hypothetical protein DL767_001208 [Monosporascus sp. MG133]